MSASGIDIEVKRFFIVRSRHFVRWADVTAATIETKKSWKGMGYSAAKFTQRTLTLKTQTARFVIDVSDSYPDVENPAGLITELRKHLDVTEVPA